MNGKAAVSLSKILAAARKGGLGAMTESFGCCYEDKDGNHCAIGCLLTKEQIDTLKVFDALHVDQTSLPHFIEGFDIEEETGLTEAQASALQMWHDTCYDGNSCIFTPDHFMDMLKNLISYKVTEIPRSPGSNNYVSFAN